MLEAIAVLLLCQLAGELVVVFMGWPVPGPVVGMALLFAGLMWRGSVPDALADTAHGLLGQLSLLFVPAGVGVMTHLALLEEQLLPLAASLVVSTLLTIAVTGLLMQRLTGRGSGQ
jgi:putative effector of murein hydrolase LrgA (UPF0299 family)